jgi:hypothetical protein
VSGKLQRSSYEAARHGWGRELLRIFSATASSTVLAVPAGAQERAASQPGQLRRHPSGSPGPNRRKFQVRGADPPYARTNRSPPARAALRPAPAASSPAFRPTELPALQPTAASAMRISGAEVNAVPFLRAGDALGVVPGLIVN